MYSRIDFDSHVVLINLVNDYKIQHSPIDFDSCMIFANSSFLEKKKGF